MLRLAATACLSLLIAISIAVAAFVALNKACSPDQPLAKLERHSHKSTTPSGLLELQVTDPNKIEGRYYASETKRDEGNWVHKFICEIKIGEFAVAAFTLFLVIFTALLWGSTHRLWKVTSDTLTHAERTAIRQLRAYVSVKEILMEQFRHPDKPTIYAGITQQGDIHHFRMGAIVENGGATPTRKAIINVNHELRDTALPSNFTFPDGELTENAAIGPGGTYGTPGFFVSIADIRKIIAKEKKLYVWGWIDYNDVFDDTPRHRTEFCFDISPDEVPDGTNLYMRFPTHGRYNGIDGDCVRQPQPYKEPKT